LLARLFLYSALVHASAVHVEHWMHARTVATIIVASAKRDGEVSCCIAFWVEQGTGAGAEQAGLHRAASSELLTALLMDTGLADLVVSVKIGKDATVAHGGIAAAGRINAGVGGSAARGQGHKARSCEEDEAYLDGLHVPLAQQSRPPLLGQGKHCY
jgi:hypothetical protein